MRCGYALVRRSDEHETCKQIRGCRQCAGCVNNLSSSDYSVARGARHAGNGDHGDLDAAQRADHSRSRMVVDRLDLAADDPQRERQEAQLGEQSRVVRKLVVEAVQERGIQPDRNRLLTAGLWEELMQMETTQLLWDVHDVEGAEREIVVVV